MPKPQRVKRPFKPKPQRVSTPSKKALPPRLDELSYFFASFYHQSAAFKEQDGQKAAVPGREAISPEPDQPGPGRPPMPQEEKDRIVDALKRDRDRGCLNFSRLAHEFDVSASTIARLAQTEGIEAQHEGMRVSPEMRDLVVETYERLHSFSATARKIGDISHKTVAKILREQESQLEPSRPATVANHSKRPSQVLRQKISP
jgi:hypothetical protein